MRRKPLSLLAACLLLISIMIGGCTSMQSQTVITPKVEKYPNKPITVIVPFSAGGALDLVARSLEKSSVKNLGQPLIIINKLGGTGTLGWNELVSANPDGYTIGITTPELFLQSTYESSKYNYLTALNPLFEMTNSPLVVAVQTDQAWQSINDLISYAKQHPGQVKFGHAGVGSLGHIIGETFSQTAGITMAQVPFQGSGEEIAALLGKHIQVAIVNPGIVKEYVKSGTIKILAVASKQHLTDPVLTNAPTFEEQGWDIVFNSRFGIAIPKELPDDIRSKLIEGLKAIITDPEFKKNVENIGLQYEYLGPDESQTYWLTDSEKLIRDVHETGIFDLIKSQKQ